MSQSNARAQAEQLTLRVHELLSNGYGDGAEADAVREEILDLWDSLEPEDRDLLDELSGDMYMLTGEETVEPGCAGDLVRLRHAWEAGEWKELLRLTRILIPGMAEHYRAYARARAWDSLHFKHAAATFFNHAWSLSANDHYLYLAMQALLDAEQIDAAWEQARTLMQRKDTSSTLLLKVADVIYAAARTADPTIAKMLYQRVLEVVEAALERPNGAKPLRAVISGGLLKKALAHIRLGEKKAADEALDEALRRDPINDALLVCRGLRHVAEKRLEHARKDFEAALRANTVISAPYLYLAHFAFSDERYDDALRLCDRALKRTTSRSVRANLLELQGVALYRLHSEHVPDAIDRLREAADLWPSNERIWRNLALFQDGDLADLSVSIDDIDADDAQEQLADVA